MTEQERQDSIGGILKRLYSGFEDTMGEGKEDHRQALNRANDLQGENTGSSMFHQMMGSNRTVTMARDMMNVSDPEARQVRQDMGLGWSEDPIVRRGQKAGVLASDIVQDRGRQLYWLLNAAQAVGTVTQDVVNKAVAPNLFAQDTLFIGNDGKVSTDGSAGLKPVKGKSALLVKDEKGQGIAYKQGDQILPKAGISTNKAGEFQRTRHRRGHVDMLNIPVGIAVNTGIGLMNPFGGQEGYKAVFESEDDPSKTSNVLGEVAAKYVLGRTGNLLPWDEFKQVRPDVSKDEYMRYKAFKFDKEGDVNLFDDGQVGLPTGIVKYTNEGIHGPEVQFLGRSLPIATAILPSAAAIASTAYGARRGGIKGGLLGGLAGTGGSMLIGNAIEGERRRRNAEENKTDTIGM